VRPVFLSFDELQGYPMKLLPRITRKIAITTLALCSITGAYANNFSYNYAQAGYSFINDFDVDQGIKISGSYDVTYNINVLGSYFISTSSDSKQADDVDLDVYTLGVGYHADISDATDVLAEIGLFNTNADVKVGGITVNTDNSGYTLSAGVRHKLQDNIEVLARFDHRNSDDITDNSLTFGSRYYFKPNWSAGIDFNTGADDGAESITGSLRWQF